MATKLASGHEVEHLKGEDIDEQRKYFGAYDYGMVKLHPGGWLFPEDFLRHANDLYNFEVHPDDVYVVTYPKVGTTWTQEIIWTMRNNPNLDNPLATDQAINTRCPFLDADMIMSSKSIPKPDPSSESFKELIKMVPTLTPEKGVMVQLANSIPKPRTIKSHLPFCLLNKDILDKSKVVYVYRNPKDTAVSFMHHHRLLKGHDYNGTDEMFVDFFMKGKLLYGFYYEHLRDALKYKDHPNLLILNFEDMKRDNKEALRKLNVFLGTSLTDQQLDNVAKFTSFDEMKKRGNLFGKDGDITGVNVEVLEKEGGFFRKGEAGTHKSKLSPELGKKIEEWTEQNFKGLEEVFPFKYS